MKVTALKGPLRGVRIVRGGRTPAWRQLHTQLSSLIAAGRIGEGANLPSERDLAEALGVSRATVKRCYDELRRSMVLGGRGRSGSVVRSVRRVEPALGKLRGFTEEMRDMGLKASTEVEDRQVTTDRLMASMFGRPSNALFLRLVRIRKGNGVPMTREVAWYDMTLAPELAGCDGRGSVYEFLQKKCGVSLRSAEQSVEAVLSSPAETRALGFERAQPCLLFKRKTYDDRSRLVEYAEGTFRGDAYVYRVRLET